MTVEDAKCEAVKYIKENNEAYFDETIEDEMFNKKEGFDPTSGSADEQFDPMLKDCLKYFIKAKRFEYNRKNAHNKAYYKGKG